MIEEIRGSAQTTRESDPRNFKIPQHLTSNRANSFQNCGRNFGKVAKLAKIATQEISIYHKNSPEIAQIRSKMWEEFWQNRKISKNSDAQNFKNLPKSAQKSGPKILAKPSKCMKMHQLSPIWSIVTADLEGES